MKRPTELAIAEALQAISADFPECNELTTFLDWASTQEALNKARCRTRLVRAGRVFACILLAASFVWLWKVHTKEVARIEEKYQKKMIDDITVMKEEHRKEIARIKDKSIVWEGLLGSAATRIAVQSSGDDQDKITLRLVAKNGQYDTPSIGNITTKVWKLFECNGVICEKDDEPEMIAYEGAAKSVIPELESVDGGVKKVIQ